MEGHMLKKINSPGIWIASAGIAGIVGIIAFVLDYPIVLEAPLAGMQWANSQVRGVLMGIYEMPGWFPLLMYGAGFGTAALIATKSNKPDPSGGLPINDSKAESSRSPMMDDPNHQTDIGDEDSRNAEGRRAQAIHPLHDAIENALDAGIPTNDI